MRKQLPRWNKSSKLANIELDLIAENKRFFVFRELKSRRKKIRKLEKKTKMKNTGFEEYAKALLEFKRCQREVLESTVKRIDEFGFQIDVTDSCWQH